MRHWDMNELSVFTFSKDLCCCFERITRIEMRRYTLCGGANKSLNLCSKNLSSSTFGILGYYDLCMII